MNGTETQLPLPKRLLAALFALVLVVGMATPPVSAWANGEDGSNGESNEQQVADNNVTISFQGSKDENLTFKYIYSQLQNKWGTPAGKDGAFFIYKNHGKKIMKNEKGSISPEKKGTAIPVAHYDGKKWIEDGTLTLVEKPTVSNAGDIKDGFTYDGDSHKWTPVLVDWESKSLKEGVDYDVTYVRNDVATEDFTNAGTILVTIQTKNGYDGTFTYSYDIKQVEGLTVSGTDYEGVYDGDAHGTAATVEMTDESEVPEDTKVEYSTDGENWSETVPTVKNVADSTTVDVRAASNNYKTVYGKYTLKVNPKTVTVTAEDKSKVYGDADPDLTATVDGLVNDESEDLITYAVARTNDDQNVGTYDGVIVASGDASQGNYSVEYGPAADFTITQRPIEVNGSATFEYNGKEQVLDLDKIKATGLVEGDTLYLKNAQVKGTEPGVYTVVTDYDWTVANDDAIVTSNYDLKVTGELTITKAANGSGSAADNGNAGKGDNAKTSSASPKTGDSIAPFAMGAGIIAIAAALAAFFVSRKLRGTARH